MPVWLCYRNIFTESPICLALLRTCTSMLYEVYFVARQSSSPEPWALHIVQRPALLLYRGVETTGFPKSLHVKIGKYYLYVRRVIEREFQSGSIVVAVLSTSYQFERYSRPGKDPIPFSGPSCSTHSNLSDRSSEISTPCLTGPGSLPARIQ